MKNIGQIGFDFGDAKPAFRADPVGTWVEPSFTFAQHSSRLQLAWDKLSTLTGFLHAIFDDSLAAATTEHAAQVKHCGYDTNEEAYKLWISKPAFGPADIAKIIDHCRQNASRTTGDVEYKIYTDGRGDVSAGVHVAGIGSIVAVMWVPRNAGSEVAYNVRFMPFRASLFRDHYYDNAEYIQLPEAVWSCAYAAQKLAESGKKIASVRTFSLNGREYIYTSGLYNGNYREAQAWSITPAADWAGDTFTYDEMIKAYEQGRLERGDHRGQLVRVRGELCVLESYVVVFDNTPGHVPYLSADEEEDEDDDCLDDGAESCYNEEEEAEFA